MCGVGEVDRCGRVLHRAFSFAEKRSLNLTLAAKHPECWACAYLWVTLRETHMHNTFPGSEIKTARRELPREIIQSKSRSTRARVEACCTLEMWLIRNVCLFMHNAKRSHPCVHSWRVMVESWPRWRILICMISYQHLAVYAMQICIVACFGGLLLMTN